MELLALTPAITSPGAAGHAQSPMDRRQPASQLQRAPLRIDPEYLCDLGDALEQAITLGSNRASARGIRLHAYIVGDLRVGEDPHAVLCTLDAMLSMATGMAVWGSLIVCEAMEEADQVVVRLQFAGEPACSGGNELALLDCDLRREWPRLPPHHRWSAPSHGARAPAGQR